MDLTWIDDRHLRAGDVQFVLDADPTAFGSTRSEPDRFLLVKRRAMIEAFLERVPRGPAPNIVELGIFKGGSTALYSELLRPRRLVAVELNNHRVPALDEYVAHRGLGDVVHLYYGTKQQDQARLRSILDDEFGDGSLDLAVDDCSHRYAPSRASFNVVFPRLRAGGLYVIEDWGWAHWPAPDWQQPRDQWASEPSSLSRLVLELVMVSASRPGLVRSVEVHGDSAYVVRGDEEVTDAGFDIGTCYLTAGRRILVAEGEELEPPGPARPLSRSGRLLRRSRS